MNFGLQAAHFAGEFFGEFGQRIRIDSHTFLFHVYEDRKHG